MTYAEAFEYCLEKVKVHYGKLGTSLAIREECYNGDYYEGCDPRVYDFVGNKYAWGVSLVTGLAALAAQTVQDKEAFRWTGRYKGVYHKKVFASNTSDTHDLGLLYVPYSVHLWQLTGDTEHRDTALRAAEVLTRRFNVYGRYIEPWKDLKNMEGHLGKIVVSSTANLSLLYWAWKESGHRYFYDIACASLDTIIRTLVREDYSVAHAWFCDLHSGELLYEADFVDTKSGSNMARNTAWMVLGLAVAYSYTQNEFYLETAVRVGEKYLQCLGDSLIPVWDFNLPAGAPAKYHETVKDSKSNWDETKSENRIYNVDTSAAAMMSCAFLMINSMSPNTVFARYADAALLCLAEHYLVPDMQKPAMLCRSNGRDAYSVCGDYFFSYALAIKLYGIMGPWGDWTGEKNRDKLQEKRAFLTDEVWDKCAGDSKMTSVLKFVDDNIDKSLTVSELSEEFHFHPDHFNRIFKAHTGVTPALYVKARKMDKVKWYLENTDLSVMEIMKMVGENDPASFSKKFKSFFAVSPREYRRVYRIRKDG